MALREGPLPASGRLRGPSLRVYDPGISAAPRRRDGLPAVIGRLRRWLLLTGPGGIFQESKAMSLLGTSTSLRSVTGCLVAGSSTPPNPNMFRSGRRRWHGSNRASAFTSSPQAVAESGRYCLPRRQRCLQTRLPAMGQAMMRSTATKSWPPLSPRYSLKNQGMM